MPTLSAVELRRRRLRRLTPQKCPYCPNVFRHPLTSGKLLTMCRACALIRRASRLRAVQALDAGLVRKPMLFCSVCPRAFYSPLLGRPRVTCSDECQRKHVLRAQKARRRSTQPPRASPRAETARKQWGSFIWEDVAQERHLAELEEREYNQKRFMRANRPCEHLSNRGLTMLAAGMLWEPTTRLWW